MKNNRFLLSSLATVMVMIGFLESGLIQFDSGRMYAKEFPMSIQDTLQAVDDPYYQLGYDQANAALKEYRKSNDANIIAHIPYSKLPNNATDEQKQLFRMGYEARIAEYKKTASGVILAFGGCALLLAMMTTGSCG